ncbi:PD-(D/E)XK nuclease family protein [Nitrosomonas sp. ANs5]|uniref:PD-(D/E)XK nuclease family protein n=1 Tax=Nitrosomonas sp. ANs5 TaxID=3423941 RepID=UPI003D3269FB
MKNSAVITHLLNPQQSNVADIIQRLEHSATIVTGNQRLSRNLRRIFDQVKISSGHQAWPAPDILPWNAWLQRLWQEALVNGKTLVSGYLLAAHQERHVWQEILVECAPDFSSHAVDQVVARLMDAWQMMRAWCLPLGAESFDYNADSQLFRKALTGFRARCRENAWLTFAEVPEMLQESFRCGVMQLPNELVLIGFDELTPQQSSFLQVIEQAGCPSRWLRLSGQMAQVTKIGCADDRSEARLAACWIRQCLEAHPAASIALVVPELTAQREMVCQALDEILLPQALQPGNHALERPYNLSLGKPLGHFPPVSMALDILGLSDSVIECAQISRLLRSSFIAGWEQEQSARALLDARLRETGEWGATLQTLLAHASCAGQPYVCPSLAHHLAALLGLIQARPLSASPGRWAQWFEQYLKVAGWPGSRTLSSGEYQVVQAWRTLVSQFAMLDWVAPAMSWETAFGRLKHMAVSTVFQPESKPASVQVLGLLETNGLQFDYLWVMGLHAGALPMAPRPNPFIPLPLQRSAGLPHSSAQRELQVAEAVLGRIAESAGTIMLSYPQRNGDEVLSPSPLIETVPELTGETHAMQRIPAWREIVHQSGRLVKFEIDPAPPLDKIDIAGGSRAFKLQAACPFLAFAELRLGARPLGKMQIGLNAMVRGNLLHRVMEMVWGELVAWEALNAASQAQLEKLVASKVNAAISEIAPSFPQTFSKRLRRLEVDRLSHLTRDWLELEKSRSPFHVLAQEKEAELTLGGVNVRLRIDRIDQLEGGDKLLIDYKTGPVKPGQWFGERPDEPQLPLYSLVYADGLAGIAFAQIRIGDLAFKGIAQEQDCVPGVSAFKQLEPTRDCTNWAEVVANWRQILEKLGQDFCAGRAEVAPKLKSITCAHCALKPLCRIDDLSGFSNTDNDMTWDEC